MNWHVILIRSFLLFLAVCLTACDRGKYVGNAASSPPLPTDVDLGHGYVRRDSAIHFVGGGTTGTGANATRIDMPSPELLEMVTKSHFGSFQTAEGLDAVSFEALSEEYTRDKDRVYFKVISQGIFLVITLPEADPATFEPLDFNLARDKNHVWIANRIQKGADPATLVLVDGGRVFKDKDSVHYAYDVIPNADPASFTHLASGYYRDKNRIYWCTDPIPDADLATFEVLGGSFVARDKNRAYRSGRVLPGVDAATVQFILDDPSGHQIIADKNGIYLNGRAFPRSKPVRTEVIDKRTVKAGDQVHVVNTLYVVPVTLFREEGKTMMEAPCSETPDSQPNGLITAEITTSGLANLRALPLPGHTWTPPFPDWLKRTIEDPFFIKQMQEAAKHLSVSSQP